ncbi:Protein white [Phytophthora citrophthora]|uniref:Protein white n=1 Tax=Phytophthora citrophthora TaxID=4793 RepID=A0AAD9G029_9STRA|nr:Protein white [Phytophthora citrophthora]
MEQPKDHFIQIASPQTAPQDMPKIMLQWQKLTLKLSVKNPSTKQLEDKQILTNVSGSARPGELLVIMGPSGAGKSTLLDCISGRNSAVNGSIMANSVQWSKRLQRFSSYVKQDDMFYATITVREHLIYQARLRMGPHTTAQQHEERVDTVLEELGLTKCRDTLIGGIRVRGISGGERKRLSFATEILTNPSLLFVDEPTSGLDSYMAEAVMVQLQQLAREGRTVITTVHQPSSELFTLFDSLYLLCDGVTVYNGKASEAVAYFAELGYQCPAFMNPTDYFMRQLIVLDREKDETGMKRLELLKSEWERKHADSREAQNSGDIALIEDAESGASGYQDNHLGSLAQLQVLSSRNVLRLVRDRISFRANFFLQLFISAIVGLIYLQLDIDQTGIQNFAGAFFVVIVNQTFTTSSPLFIAIPTELPMVLHEYKSGLYRLAVWYMAKILSELPLQVFMPFVFFIPTYFLIGIGHGFITYIKLQLFVVLLNFGAVGVGYMVSCLCRRVEIAPIVGIVVLLPFMLFGGLFLNASSTPSYFVWIQYISPIKYGYEGMMKVFWREINTIPCASDQSCIARTGQKVLEYYSMDNLSAGFDAIMLFVLGIAFRLVGLVVLWINVRKKN